MDKKAEIAILMSTYNGERFLAEQIESIIGQTYQNWQLYIRDDGSKDDTQQIIKKYSSLKNNIHFFNEDKVDNVGVVKSFMTLLANTKADYYMFSDQDDFWRPTKVEHTLELMTKHDDGKPVCVHTDLQIVDSQLQGTEIMNGNKVWHSFIHLMFGNCVTGCTVMINNALKNKLQLDKLNLNRVYMHDWWVALVAAYFGRVVYLNEPTILYRQHGNNVVGSMKKNTIPHLIHRVLNQKIDQENLLNVFRNSDEFKRMYGEELSGIDKVYIEEYSNLIYNGSPSHNFKIMIEYPPKRNHIKGKIFFSYLMIKDYKQIGNLMN